MTKEVMHPKAAAMEQLSFSASAGQTALAHLCGPLDENLRQMETILGVKIVRRGEQFRVSGEKHAAHRALRALEVLLDRVARTGAELTPNDIQWHFVGGDDEHRAKTANADEVSAGEVLLKTRRHDLRGRTPNQRAYLQAILSHDISFGIGPAGTSKTYLAVAAAVDAFERGTVERIVLTRPAVEAGERLGFLPGDLSQKVDPYLRPLYDALFDLMGFDKVQRLMERQSIEVAPLAWWSVCTHTSGTRRFNSPKVVPGQQRLCYSRRSTEYDGRADENVFDAHRVRVQSGNYGRYYAD